VGERTGHGLGLPYWDGSTWALKTAREKEGRFAKGLQWEKSVAWWVQLLWAQSLAGK
jgi:hypothetical protein